MIHFRLESYPEESQSALSALAAFQRSVDAHTSYVERVTAAAMEWTMFSTYQYLLQRYASAKSAGAGSDELDRITIAIQHQGHRTVWEEMKRQRPRVPALGALFDAAPEALHW